MQTNIKTEIALKMNEAEVCRSMGLLAESLSVYEQILTKKADLASQDEETIRNNIKEIKKEIADLEQVESQAVSEKELSFFKETMTSEQDIQAILDSASAFKDLGLHSEAIDEYKKLFFLDYDFKKIIPKITESIIKAHSPKKIIEQTDEIFKGDEIEKSKLALIILGFGKEMEKRDNREIALELYDSARKIDPQNSEIKERLESLNASFSTGSRYDYLLNQNIVTKSKLQKAFAMSQKMKKSVEYVLNEHMGIDRGAISKSLALYYGCNVRDYKPDLPIPFELLRNLKESFLLNDHWVPISWEKDGIEILVDDPKDLNKTDHISALMKTRKIKFSVAIKEDIAEYIKRFFDKDSAAGAQLAQDEFDDIDIMPDVEFEEEDEVEEESDESESSSKVVKIVDQFIISAYRKNASDIHVEPSPVTKATSIRFRMDGVCQDYLKIPNSMAKGILSRLKIMANLDIAERRLPQDGKIKFKRKNMAPFELRMATLPTAGGYEDAVLRLLAKAGAMKLSDLMLSERNFEVLKSVIAKPYGLVLVVGPTGSGKTTTLHSALGEINTPSIKIWTAEDPVEITQAGLIQVEAKTKIGLDFPKIMRAFLRADPDVIMIGEMRDEETASIGIEASLTGHLVFSTLHTNSAPETITRLLDMGLNPLNFSDAFLGVLAQRLVRRLCKECRQEYKLSRDEFDEIVNDYGKPHFKKTGIKFSSDLTLYRPGTCDLCSGTGYKGRLGIHELMDGSPEIKKMIKKQASTEDLFKISMGEGMTTLKQDGILKVFQGITDISEIRRVCIN